MQGEYNFKVSRIVCKLNLRDRNQFATQDTNIFLKDTSIIYKKSIYGEVDYNKKIDHNYTYYRWYLLC